MALSAAILVSVLWEEYTRPDRTVRPRERSTRTPLRSHKRRPDYCGPERTAKENPTDCESRVSTHLPSQTPGQPVGREAAQGLVIERVDGLLVPAAADDRLSVAVAVVIGAVLLPRPPGLPQDLRIVLREEVGAVAVGTVRQHRVMK